MGTHRRGAGPIWEWANALLESEIGFPGPARQVSEPPSRRGGVSGDEAAWRMRADRGSGRGSAPPCEGGDMGEERVARVAQNALPCCAPQRAYHVGMGGARRRLSRLIRRDARMRGRRDESDPASGNETRAEPTAPERTEGWTEDPLVQRLRNLEWPTVDGDAREGSWLRFQGLLDSAEVGAHQADRGSDQPETERRGSG